MIAERWEFARNALDEAFDWGYMGETLERRTGKVWSTRFEVLALNLEAERSRLLQHITAIELEAAVRSAPLTWIPAEQLPVLRLNGVSEDYLVCVKVDDGSRIHSIGNYSEDWGWEYEAPVAGEVVTHYGLLPALPEEAE